MPRKESDPHPFQILGFDLGGLPEHSQFIVLALGHVVCALTFALLQEKVFLVPGFSYGGFMALCETSTYFLCALLELYLSGNLKPRAKALDYFLLSIFTYSGMYLTNWSLQYLSYPTRVMFKSSKVIPVMLVGVMYLKRKYSVAEYFNVLILVGGIVLFTMGDVDSSPTFNGFGLVLITGGVIFDSFTANFEEKRFFKEHGCSHAEIMCFTSAVSTCWSALLLKSTGELDEALVHAMEHREVFYYMITFSAVNYFSISFILLLISHFGSTNAEIVKSTRKVFSIILSYLAYAKPFTSRHLIGGALFVVSVVYGVHLKRQKNRHQALKAQKVQENGS